MASNAQYQALLGVDFNPLDPLGSVSKYLGDLYNKMQDFINQLIINPPRTSNSGILDIYYTAAANLSEYLAYVSFIVILSLTVLFLRKGKRLIEALVVVFITAALAPTWVFVVDQLDNTGTKVAELANIYQPPPGPLGGIGDVVNPIGSIAAYSLSLASGVSLAVVLMNSAYLIILMKFWGLITYSISAIGPRAKKVSNAVLSLGLVATLFGRATTIFFRDIGRLAIETFPFGKSPFGIVIYSVGADFAALISWVVLIIACYVGLTKVEGYVSSLASGAVRTAAKGTTKVDVQRIRRNHQAGMRPMPVVIARQQKSFLKEKQLDVKQHAGRKAAKLAGGALTAAGYPAVGAGVNKFGGQFVDNKIRKQRGSDTSIDNRRRRRQ